MHIELNPKAKAKALTAAGVSGRSPNYLTNLMWEALEVIDIEELVKLSMKVNGTAGEGKKEFRKPLKITVKL